MPRRRQCGTLAPVFPLLLSVAVAATVLRGSDHTENQAKYPPNVSLKSSQKRQGRRLAHIGNPPEPEHGVLEITEGIELGSFDGNKFAAVEADLRRYVSEAAADVAADERPCQIMSKPVQGISSSSIAPECVVPASLKKEDIERAAAEIFGQDSFSLGSPTCFGSVVTYSTIGKACSMPTESLLKSYYERGITLMLLGATTREAFVPFIHVRVLASNLVACHPNLNPGGTTALPDSYGGLYDLYATKLIGRLRDSKRLRDAPGSQTLNISTQCISGKMKAAVSHPIFSPIGYNDKEFLPSQDELSLFSTPDQMWSPMSLEFTERAGYANTGNMTEEACDAGVDARDYFLHLLEYASNPYENCCSFACSAVLSVARGFRTSMNTCCKGCNRYSCRENTEEKIETVAQVAEIFGVAKADMTPVLYTFVV